MDVVESKGERSGMVKLEKRRTLGKALEKLNGRNVDLAFESNETTN